MMDYPMYTNTVTDKCIICEEDFIYYKSDGKLSCDGHIINRTIIL